MNLFDKDKKVGYNTYVSRFVGIGAAADEFVPFLYLCFNLLSGVYNNVSLKGTEEEEDDEKEEEDDEE